MSKSQEPQFLPTIPPMPTPPKDTDDIDTWKKHIEAVDKYIANLNEAIAEINPDQLADHFKQKMREQGININQMPNLPPDISKDIAEKTSAIIEKMNQMQQETRQQIGQRHTAGMVKRQSNITPI